VTLQGATHTGFPDVASIFMENMDNPDLLGCLALESGPSYEVDFPAILGGEEAGIIQYETPYPCRVDPLPRSLRPSRQHDLTLLAVFSFFESRFADAPSDRARAAQYLRNGFAAENPEARVQ